MGVRIRGAFGDMDPLNKVPFKRSRSGLRRGPLSGVSLIVHLTIVQGSSRWRMATRATEPFTSHSREAQPKRRIVQRAQLLFDRSSCLRFQ